MAGRWATGRRDPGNHVLIGHTEPAATDPAQLLEECVRRHGLLIGLSLFMLAWRPWTTRG
jgi:hypothetical protein